MAGRSIRWRVLAAAIAASATLVTAAWLLLPPIYLTNDDISIRLGIEGRTAPGQAPTGFLLMTHSALGWALVALHDALPSAPLWDILLTATVVAGIGLFLALTWSGAPPGWLSRATATCALLIAVVPLLSGVQ